MRADGAREGFEPGFADVVAILAAYLR